LKIIRWILLAPGAISAWYVVFSLGIVSLSIRDYFCPSEYIVSGMCTGAFAKITSDLLLVLFSGIAAFFVVVTSALIAPEYKGYMAVAAFAVGGSVATKLLFSLNFEFWKEFVSAITFGAVACYFAVKKHPFQPKIE
jgi:hypothetical protein